MSQREYVLEMRGITKEFPGVRALSDVSFNLRPGTVHALMGENGAGKSTLMKCLFGIYARDAGEVLLDGKAVSYTCTLDAIRDGVAMIHQELYPEPHLSVMENIWLGRLPVKHGIVDRQRLYRDTRELLDRLNIDLDPRAIVRTLSVSKIQSIEIAKAVSLHARVIIMDEPTSSLTSAEVEHFFSIINDLRAKGVAIVYISHKIEEIKVIADEISIMRDGQMIGTWATRELTTDDIISRMVGRDMSMRFPPKTNVCGENYLEVTDLCSANERSFQHISFTLRKGEILGIGGLVGAQRTELVESIFGLRALKSGEIRINGKPVKIRNASDAMQNGLALLTEDRKRTCLFPVLGVGENVYVTIYRKIVRFFGYISARTCNRLAAESIKKLDIKTPSQRTPINSLSGGNQQKALFARWLLTEPDILLLDEPTRGIDVGAKYEIYKIMDSLAAEGKCVIMISSEMPELLGMADRIMVMCEGKLSGIIEGEDMQEENIMRLAAKYMV
ncbi:MAG: sugar ABC transporter ATP-binding protein [Eubacteriales bacterium]|nr:sugar ABC transporter ATP-binding protein [Eubacteriales bacterium]